jgi:hypothetical protein
MKLAGIEKPAFFSVPCAIFINEWADFAGWPSGKLSNGVRSGSMRIPTG